MKLRRCIFLGLFSALLTAAPEVATRGVKSAGTSAPDSGVGRGSAFVIRGKGLGPANAKTGDLPYGRELGGVKVTLQSREGGQAAEALLIEVSAKRIVGIVPSALAAGEYDVRVSFEGETSRPEKVRVAERNPGIVTIGYTNGGLALAEAGEAEKRAVLYSVPAVPGAVVTMEAAGFGPVNNDAEAPGEQPKLEDAKVIVGDVEVPALYAGRSPQRPGFDRVVFQLPVEGAALGCLVPVALKAGGATSEPAHLPLAASADAPCEHPAGFSAESLRRLDAGETVIVPDVQIAESVTEATFEGQRFEMRSRSIAGSFIEHTLETLGANALSYFSMFSKNGCYVSSSEGEELAELQARALDAGEALSVSGAAGFNAKVPRKEGNEYLLDFSSGIPNFPGIPGLPQIPGLPGTGTAALDALPGEYEVTGSGGADVQPFAAKLQLSAPVTWSNRQAVQRVDREAGLEITWTAGPARDRVTILGFAGVTAPGDGGSGEGGSDEISRPDMPRFRGASFLCETSADKGAFTVPAEILRRLPRTEGLENASGLLVVSHDSKAPNGELRVRSTDGKESEKGSFGFSYSWMKPVAFR